jgi:hypothetical protein
MNSCDVLGIEMLTYHRRGQWFKSSTAHHLKNIISLISMKSSC